MERHPSLSIVLVGALACLPRFGVRPDCRVDPGPGKVAGWSSLGREADLVATSAGQSNAESVTSAKVKTIQNASSFRSLLLTGLTMAFFAANSLLARLALRSGEIDGGSFTAVRIVAGAGALALLMSFRREGVAVRRNGSLWPAFALFSYAITFSFAYLSLSASTGALVLFAAVQMTMLGLGIAGGERPRSAEWIGLTVAFGGLVYLVSPGLTAPSRSGSCS